MKCAASANDITNLMANSETFLPSSKRIACQAHQEVVDANTILGPDRAKKLPSSSHMSSSQSYWLSSMSSLLHTAFSIVTCKTCTADLNTVSTASSRNTLNAVSPGVSYRRGNSAMKDKDVKWARFKMSSKSTKKAAAAAASNHPANGGANYSPGTTPLGSSPPTGGGNNFFTSFTSRNNNNNANSNVITSNSTCSPSFNTSSSTKDLAAASSPLGRGTSSCSATGVAGAGNNSTPNFHISSLPITRIGNGGVGATAASAESSPCESADEISCSNSIILVSNTNQNNHVPYLTCCTSQERRERYKECKSMVQLPRGFDKLEWLAYHATFLVRFAGMFWLSNGLSQQCRCSTLSAPHNVTWTMLDERTGKKITSKNSGAVDARALIENSLKNLEKILDNEELFPSKYGNQFNGDFENLVKRCCRSMYLMISHVLHAHHFFLSENKIDTSFIDLFAYLITFVREFSLMDRKDLPALEQVEFTLSRYS